jgi:hypothetical protein
MHDVSAEAHIINRLRKVPSLVYLFGLKGFFVENGHKCPCLAGQSTTIVSHGLFLAGVIEGAFAFAWCLDTACCFKFKGSVGALSLQRFEG